MMAKVVRLPEGEGWSIWYRPPRHMRWLDHPVRDVVTYVAKNTATGRLYYVWTCQLCGGKYLANRIDSKVCSARCRQLYRRTRAR